MPDYRKIYHQLMGRVADAIDLLILAQLKAEEAVIAACPDEDEAHQTAETIET